MCPYLRPVMYFLSFLLFSSSPHCECECECAHFIRSKWFLKNRNRIVWLLPVDGMAEVRWCRPSAGIPFWLCATACAAWEIDFVPLNDERHFRASLFTVISVAYEPVWTDASTRAPFSGSRLGTQHTNKTLWCSILGKIKVWIMPTACSICAYIFIFTLLFSFSFPFFFLFFFFLCRVKKGFAFNAIPFVWWAVFIEKLMTKSFRHLSVCVRRRINEMEGSDRRRKKNSRRWIFRGTEIVFVCNHCRRPIVP